MGGSIHNMICTVSFAFVNNENRRFSRVKLSLVNSAKSNSLQDDLFLKINRCCESLTNELTMSLSVKPIEVTTCSYRVWAQTGTERIGKLNPRSCDWMMTRGLMILKSGTDEMTQANKPAPQLC